MTYHFQPEPLEKKRDISGGVLLALSIVMAIAATSFVAYHVGRYSAYRETLPELNDLRRAKNMLDAKAENALNDRDNFADQLKECRATNPTPTPKPVIERDPSI